VYFLSRVLVYRSDDGPQIGLSSYLRRITVLCMTEHYISTSIDLSTTALCHLQITKYRSFQVDVVVENVEKLDVGCCLYLLVCVIFVESLAALPVRFTVCKGSVVVSLYDTHEAEILGCNCYNFLIAGRKLYVPVEMLFPEIETLFITATNFIKSFTSLIKLQISTQ